MMEMKKKSDIANWLIAGILFVAAMFANYHYTDIAGPIKAIAWIVVLAAIGAILALTTVGKAVVTFARESRVEMRKVVWPTRQETTQTTIVVMVLVLIVALLLWIMDSGLLALIGWLTGQR